jgi:hypothetical protein
MKQRAKGAAHPDECSCFDSQLECEHNNNSVLYLILIGVELF